ncbi:MAG TPA: hypothetical protein VFG83_08535, partial [Kofleriaceae bacterium]|nr:hypothetical protein [Kofleriaceae bacterium]
MLTRSCFLAFAVASLTACSSHTETPLIDAAGTGVDARPIDARTGDTDGGAGAATCEAYGYSCGDITGDNGEILSCGTCNSGETCNDHHCDARKPQACAEAGATCGQIDDGMGGTLDCGVCRAPATCGGAGRANLCAVPEGTPPAAGEWTWLSPSPIPLNAVDSFAVAANDVWAVGADGDVRHFDGTTWEAVAGGTNLDLHAVWGASADDVWIAGEGGALLHWDGEVFVPVVAGQGQADLRALAGTSASDVWLVGDGISMHYNGSAWSPAAATTPSLDALYIAATDDVWAIGEDLIWRFDSDSGWSSLPQYAPIQRLRGIYGRSPDEIYVVGYFAKTLQCDDELVFAWDGTAFTSIDTAADGSIQGIYGSTGQVVAARSSVPFCHGAGLSVLSGPAGLLNPPASIATATQLSPTQQFLLSELGEAFTSGGGAWTKSGTGTYQNLGLLAVIGDEVWAASARSIFEWQGDDLVEHPQGLAVDSTLVALAGASPTDVWALDFNPTTLVSGPLHHWN